jgi:hypothetical protein
LAISCGNKNSNQDNNKSKSVTSELIDRNEINESDSSEMFLKKSFELMDKENIGEIRLHKNYNEIVETYGEPNEISEPSFSDVDGEYYLSADYPEKGIFLVFLIKNDSVKEVATIEIKKPSELKTSKQIGIGNNYEEVKNAYKELFNSEFSDAETIVIGSIYGGIIFNFMDNKVERIYIGASAE